MGCCLLSWPGHCILELLVSVIPSTDLHEAGPPINAHRPREGLMMLHPSLAIYKQLVVVSRRLARALLLPEDLQQSMGLGRGKTLPSIVQSQVRDPDPAQNTSPVLLLGGLAGKLVGSIEMGQGRVIEGEQSKDMLYTFENVIRKPTIIHK